MKILVEIKLRNVIRMAGLYLVGAWLVVQVAATLLPTFDAPAWVMKVLVALLAICFLAAVVFSWLYELTPEGLKRCVEPEEGLMAADAGDWDWTQNKHLPTGNRSRRSAAAACASAHLFCGSALRRRQGSNEAT